ncbi:MAG: flagellar biosynthesis anti-sigma factor FlgM [Burkholderiales bacterium]
MTIGSTSNKTQGLPVASASTGPAVTPANARASGEAAAVTPTEASTQVALSSAATSLLAGSTSSVEFDSAKVERVSQAIEKGDFKVDAGAIADKLIANAAELLKKSTPES